MPEHSRAIKKIIKKAKRFKNDQRVTFSQCGEYYDEKKFKYNTPKRK